mgnify:CR=1 FL=1
MITRYITFAAVVFLSGTLTTVAQSKPSYNGTIKVAPVRVLQSGETLHVEMEFILNHVKVRSAGAVDLIPRLVSSTDTLELPRVSLKGRNEYSNYERVRSLMSKAEQAAYLVPYRVEKSVKVENRTIQYRYTLPYESWMAGARLVVQRDECGCGEIALMDIVDVDTVTLEVIPVPYQVTPYMAYVQPVPEPVKHREKQAETFLDFVVNQIVIRPDYMNNPKELAKIHALIDELRVDTDITINRLDIIGYASPEGSLANNKRLSEGRALALKNYLASRYTFPTSLYHIVFGGENWDGLRKALAGLHVEYKSEVETVINFYDGQERKNRLKSLHGGEPYRYLLRNIYPSLRVAICKVEYHVKNFNAEEAREVIKVRPQNLSLNEMYLVANTYPNGSQEFIDVFETAVRLFPEDDIAHLNAAAAALSRGDTITAGRHMEQVKQKELPEYANAAGVLALLKGDYVTAAQYLQTAMNAGLEVAGKNMEELEKKRMNAIEINSRVNHKQTYQ